jgi:hypothetical protein
MKAISNSSQDERRTEVVATRDVGWFLSASRVEYLGLARDADVRNEHLYQIAGYAIPLMSC